MCLLVSCFKYSFPKTTTTCFELAFMGYKNFTLNFSKSSAGYSKGIIVSSISFPRNVALKAFENLLYHELLIPADSMQRHYPKHLMAVRATCHFLEVTSALSVCDYFPEIILEWARSS